MYKKNAGFYKTLEFEKWFNAQPQIDKWYILESFSRIMADGYFDDHRWLGDGLWELKWQNGRRVYYGYIPSLDIVVVLGGNKNDQKRDIARAKKIFKKFQEASKKQCFGTDSFNPLEELLDRAFLGKTIIACLRIMILRELLLSLIAI